MAKMPQPAGDILIVTYADDTTVNKSGPKHEPICKELNAYLDVLDKFDVSMSDEEEKSFYRNHFEPAWKKFSDGTTLDYVRTPGFFQELIKRIN